MYGHMSTSVHGPEWTADSMVDWAGQATMADRGLLVDKSDHMLWLTCVQVAPRLAGVLKPHQLKGVAFIWTNVVQDHEVISPLVQIWAYT